MAETIQELLVKVTPEGIEKTQKDLEDTGDTFSDVSGEAGDAAGDLTGMATKFRGAMTAIMGGFAIATAGLLSKVPVVQEQMDLLGGTLTALGLAMDRDLRPALQDGNRAFAEMNNEIAGADGLGEALGILLRGMKDVNKETNRWASIKEDTDFSVPISISVPDFEAALSEIEVPSQRDVSVGVSLELPDLSMFTEWINSDLKNETTTAERVGNIDLSIDFPTIDLKNALTTALELFLDFNNIVLSTLQKLWIRVRTGFENMWNLVVEFGKAATNKMTSIVETAVNTIIRSIPAFARNELGISTVDLGQPFKNVRSIDEIAEQGQQRLTRRLNRATAQESERAVKIDELIQALRNNEQTTSIQLDNQKLAESQVPYIADNVGLRGR